MCRAQTASIPIVIAAKIVLLVFLSALHVCHYLTACMYYLQLLARPPAYMFACLLACLPAWNKSIMHLRSCLWMSWSYAVHLFVDAMLELYSSPFLLYLLADKLWCFVWKEVKSYFCSTTQSNNILRLYLKDETSTCSTWISGQKNLWDAYYSLSS